MVYSIKTGFFLCNFGIFYCNKCVVLISHSIGSHYMGSCYTAVGGSRGGPKHLPLLAVTMNTGKVLPFCCFFFFFLFKPKPNLNTHFDMYSQKLPGLQ